MLCRYEDQQQDWDSDAEAFRDEHGSDESEDSDENTFHMHTESHDAGAASPPLYD